MITTRLYKGQGLGNQLWCYVVTRVIAVMHGYRFGISSPEKFKGAQFMHLSFGEKVRDIKYRYREQAMFHPITRADIRMYDSGLLRVSDSTELSGVMQGEEYIAPYKEKIREWLAIDPRYDRTDFSDETICIINFRGGEYVRHNDLFLPKRYWLNAIDNMRKRITNPRFVVITDDVKTAKIFFPQLEVHHFSIGEDYAIISHAKYLILSNSSFSWFAAWLNPDLRYCIAPKYWARHAISDGYWSLSTNITTGWWYQDRDGTLYDSESCKKELAMYIKKHSGYYVPSEEQASGTNGALFFMKSMFGLLFSQKTRTKMQHFIGKIHGKLWHFWRKIAQNLYSISVHFYKNHKEAHGLSSYREKAKVYDVFTYNGEEDILEIRLNILYEHIDYFIIVEAPTTFSGKKKPLYFEMRKERFKQFMSKIIYFVIDDYPNDQALLALADKSPLVPHGGPEHWRREFYQKESIKKALAKLDDEDICFIGDVDEIWNPDILLDLNRKSIYKLQQELYVYYLNYKCLFPWKGTIVTRYKTIKNTSLNHLRGGGIPYQYLDNGGWHFTNIGGLAEVKRKMNDSYTEESYYTKEIQQSLETRFGVSDHVGRRYRYTIDEHSLPSYILNNREKYKTLFK